MDERISCEDKEEEEKQEKDYCSTGGVEVSFY